MKKAVPRTLMMARHEEHQMRATAKFGPLTLASPSALASTDGLAVMLESPPARVPLFNPVSYHSLVGAREFIPSANFGRFAPPPQVSPFPVAFAPSWPSESDASAFYEAMLGSYVPPYGNE